LDFAEEFRLVLKTSSANFAPDDLTIDSGHSVRVPRFENPSFFRPKPRFSAVDRVFGTHSRHRGFNWSDHGLIVPPSWEGNSQVVWFEDNYEDYDADRHRRLGAQADQSHRIKYKPLTR
jgi:hypothetical protein